jgi:hypothetical protein
MTSGVVGRGRRQSGLLSVFRHYISFLVVKVIDSLANSTRQIFKPHLRVTDGAVLSACHDQNTRWKRSVSTCLPCKFYFLPGLILDTQMV